MHGVVYFCFQMALILVYFSGTVVNLTVLMAVLPAFVLPAMYFIRLLPPAQSNEPKSV